MQIIILESYNYIEETHFQSLSNYLNAEAMHIGFGYSLLHGPLISSNLIDDSRPVAAEGQDWHSFVSSTTRAAKAQLHPPSTGSLSHR
jgi:hypothetical protein